MVEIRSIPGVVSHRNPYLNSKRCISKVPRVVTRIVKCSGSFGTSTTGPLLKACLRCGEQYLEAENSPIACRYHGHMTGIFFSPFSTGVISCIVVCEVRR